MEVTAGLAGRQIVEVCVLAKLPCQDSCVCCRPGICLQWKKRCVYGCVYLLCVCVCVCMCVYVRTFEQIQKSPDSLSGASSGANNVRFSSGDTVLICKKGADRTVEVVCIDPFLAGEVQMR